MADKVLRLKIIPDVTELKKSLSKLAIGGKGGGGGSGERQLKEESNKRSQESKKILGSLRNIVKFVSISAFVASLFAGLIRVMEPIFRILSVILTLLFLPLIPVMKKAMIALIEFAKSLAGSASAFLAGDIDLSEFLGEIIGSIKDIFLTDKVRASVSEGLNNMFRELGEFVGENGADILSGFIGAIGAFLQGLATGFTSFIEGLTEKLGGIKAAIVVILGGVLIGIFLAFGGWIALLAVILGTIAFKLGLKIGEFLTFIFVKIKDAWFTFIDDIKALFTRIVDKIRGFLSLFKRGGGDKEDTSGGDMIIRPNGQIIRTDPADTLIATKNPDELFGGRGGFQTFAPNITIQATINNDMDIRDIAEKIAEFSNDELSRRTTLTNF